MSSSPLSKHPRFTTGPSQTGETSQEQTKKTGLGRLIQKVSTAVGRMRENSPQTRTANSRLVSYQVFASEPVKAGAEAKELAEGVIIDPFEDSLVEPEVGANGLADWDLIDPSEALTEKQKKEKTLIIKKLGGFLLSLNSSPSFEQPKKSGFLKTKMTSQKKSGDSEPSKSPEALSHANTILTLLQSHKETLMTLKDVEKISHALQEIGPLDREIRLDILMHFLETPEGPGLLHSNPEATTKMTTSIIKALVDVLLSPQTDADSRTKSEAETVSQTVSEISESLQSYTNQPVPLGHLIQMFAKLREISSLMNQEERSQILRLIAILWG